MGGVFFRMLLVAALGASLAGCGAKHTVGDTVIYDPGAEEKAENPGNGPASEGEGDGQGAKGSSSDPVGESTQEAKSTEPDAKASHSSGAQGPAEPTKPEPQAGQFMKAKGTSIGDEDWRAEIRGEGKDLWLASPYDAERTYAMVRAATYLQGLRMAEEDFQARRFTTTLGYKAWHSDDEGGLALTMKVLTKGFGKDARYRFRVSVTPRDDGGSRVDVAQYREVMEEDLEEDVGDWVEADEPDPEITRKYLQGVQRAIGE